VRISKIKRLKMRMLSIWVFIKKKINLYSQIRIRSALKKKKLNLVVISSQFNNSINILKWVGQKIIWMTSNLNTNTKISWQKEIASWKIRCYLRLVLTSHIPQKSRKKLRNNKNAGMIALRSLKWYLHKKN
jgi:hypothetical protein